MPGSQATPQSESRSQVLTAALVVLIVAILAGLPLSLYFDVRDASARLLKQHVEDIDQVMTSVRLYYTTNVIQRVKDGHGVPTQMTHNYDSIPGAIPIPATLSLELARVVSDSQKNFVYRFVSDYTFKDRAPHYLDAFETHALKALREQPDMQIMESSMYGLSSHVRIVTPVIMGAACVDCHNHHPDSPKRDWKVGDVRGIQEVAVTQPMVSGAVAFKHLLLYVSLTVVLGVAVVYLLRQQRSKFTTLQKDLHDAQRRITMLDPKGATARVFSEQLPGLTLLLNPNAIDVKEAGRVRSVLTAALLALQDK